MSYRGAFEAMLILKIAHIEFLLQKFGCGEICMRLNINSFELCATKIHSRFDNVWKRLSTPVHVCITNHLAF